MTQLLSPAEIRRRLQLVRYSPRSDRQAGRSVGLSRIAREAGLDRDYLDSLVCGFPITPGTRTHIELSRVLQHLVPV